MASADDEVSRESSRLAAKLMGVLLSGHFVLDRFGPAELYVESGHPPYVVVRAQDRVIIVNFRDQARTAALYDTLTKSLHRRRQG
jgi:hypothetical protein